MPTPLLDVARLDRPDTIVAGQPFRFLVAKGQLDEARADALRADFPRYGSAGFFPYEPADCGPALRGLIDEIRAPAFAEALGRKLGIENLGGRAPGREHTCEEDGAHDGHEEPVHPGGRPAPP